MKIYRDQNGQMKIGDDPNRVIVISSSEEENENESDDSETIEISSDDDENLDIPNQGLSGQSDSDESMDGDDVPLHELVGPAGPDSNKSDEKMDERQDSVTPGAVSDIDLDNVRFWPSGSSSDDQSDDQGDINLDNVRFWPSGSSSDGHDDGDSDDEFANPLIPGKFLNYFLISWGP